MNVTIAARRAGVLTRRDARPKSPPSWLRRLFSDRPERSLRLRMIALSGSLWAALSLILIGTPPWAPMGAMAGSALGHYVSWKRRGKGTPYLSLAIGLFIVLLGIYMRTDMVAAIRGDRIPIAYFLLATSTASAFDLRTRAGLYTQFIAAGIVMFFASELAFGVAFAPLLAVYGVLLLAFMALAYLEDEFEDARVDWFKSRAASAGFWSAVAVIVAALSVGAFLLLPWNSAQAPHAPRLAIMPFSGVETGNEPPMSPEMARAVRERIRRQNEIAASGAGTFGATAGNGAKAFAQANGGAGLAGTSGGSAASLPLGADGLSATMRVGEPLEAGSANSEDLVAYVRSAVASYWRGRTYDSFEPSGGAGGVGEWYATLEGDRLPGPVFASAALDPAAADKRYLQTFFAQKDLGSGVLTGYNAVAAALPRDADLRPLLGPGATYQIVSRQPDFSAEGLRSDTTMWLGPTYAALPPGLEPLRALTSEIVRDAETEFDRAAAIASYLHQLDYDRAAANPLVPGGPLMEFVYGERPGTAIDFATAMTLMARAAGLPARLATGYLPGDYNPLSGASRVTEDLAHAWAEVNFVDAGWVPFDAAPRPELPTAATLADARSNGLSRLLDRRFGDALAAAAGKAPGAAWNGLKYLMGGGAALAAALAAGLLGAGIGWLLLGRFGARRGASPAALTYARLPGRARRDVLDAFRQAETMLARRGFRRRNANETYSDYARAAQAVLGIAGKELGGLARASWRAAYSSAPVPAAAAALAKGRLRSLARELQTAAKARSA